LQAALLAGGQFAIRRRDIELIDAVANDGLMHRFQAVVAMRGACAAGERRRQSQDRPSCDFLHHFAPEIQRVT
jgi:hypothetical protein